MSHSFIDPKNDYYNYNDDSDTPQKKIDPVAQLKSLSTQQVDGGWGLFNSQPAQMFAQDEEEQQQKPDEEKLMQGKAEDEELQMKEKPTEKQGSSGTQTSIPNDVRGKMESSFGTDFSGVNIHQNSDQASNIGALAYTQGNDVHFAPGQYNPGSQKGQELLGHELTHVVQQRQGRVKPTKQGKGLPVNDNPTLEKEADVMGAKAAQGKMADVAGNGSGVQRQKNDNDPVFSSYYPVKYYNLSLLNKTFAYSDDKLKFTVKGAPVYFKNGEMLEMIESDGEWLKVKSKNGHYIDANGVEKNNAKISGYHFWIKKSNTHIKKEANSTDEKQNIIDDLQIFLNTEINAQLKKIDKASCEQAKRYKKAYELFNKALVDDKKDEEIKTKIMFSVLTAVSMGALGWLGDAAAASKNLSNLMFAGLEDGVQAGFGELKGYAQDAVLNSINISNTNLDPLSYYQEVSSKMKDIQYEATGHVGKIQDNIRRTNDVPDRACILTNIYDWLNSTLIPKAPRDEPKWNEFQDYIERGFWKNQLLKLVSYSEDPFAGKIANYTGTGDNTRERLDALGITEDAGIDGWPYFFDESLVPPTKDEHGPEGSKAYYGSKSTRKLIIWAKKPGYDTYYF